MRLVLACLLAPALASAAPKLTTSMTVRVEDQPAGFTVTAKLDACWKKAAKAKAIVTIEGGKITKVDRVESSDPRAKRCIEKALRAATTDAPASVIVTIELEGSRPASAKNPKVLDSGLGAVKVVGSMQGGASDVDRVVRSRAGVFRACYQKELNRAPKLAGKIVASFTIATDGRVTRAEVATSTLGDANVEACVIANVARLKFPAQRAQIEVTYPFVFSGL